MGGMRPAAKGPRSPWSWKRLEGPSAEGVQPAQGSSGLDCEGPSPWPRAPRVWAFVLSPRTAI